MGLISIDGKILKKLIIGGANEITMNTSKLNALNVFPVPDGDTGTNMGHTVRAAALEAIKLSSPSVSEIAKAASGGALRGARGNSGVIFSQFFRGFAKGLEGKSVANAEDLAEALAKSSEAAYKAVMKPKEGTMLTIGRVIAEAAFESTFDRDDVISCLKHVVDKANETLAKTPDMLPVLKQAGVVDSGGMGVVFFLKGALKAAKTDGEIALLEHSAEDDEHVPASALSAEDIKYQYCTEFLIELDAKSSPPPVFKAEDVMHSFLPMLGDSVVVIEDEGLVKVHVHTNHPGRAIEKALQFGQLLNIKIENMKAQHNELMDFSVNTGPAKPIGIVVVAEGAGFHELFKGLGADICITGGQSMNPSAEEIAAAIDKVNADVVIVLPNNKNIILTAQQAAGFAKKDCVVVPTRSIPQGVSCVIANADTIPIDENIKVMEEAMEATHSGQITMAVRDTTLEGKEIKEGDFICIYDGDIVLVEKTLDEGARALANHMLDFGGDIVSIYYGKGITEEMAENLKSYIVEEFPNAEVEIFFGEQSLYSYILSVE